MTNMTKDKWVAIMKAAGLTEAPPRPPRASSRLNDDRRASSALERASPDDHQEFLESLHIQAAEIQAIRAWR